MSQFILDLDLFGLGGDGSMLATPAPAGEDWLRAPTTPLTGTHLLLSHGLPTANTRPPFCH